MKDIAPDLLKAIQDDFNERVKTNAKVRNALKAMKSKNATFKDANSFAEAIGDALAESFKNNIKPELLPDERMYYNIAERVVGESLKNNYNLVSEYSADVQTLLNRKANLGLKGIKPQYNTDKAKGIINRISSEEKYEDISWILEEPVTNFTQSIVDDAIKRNAEFQYKAGLKAKIIRKSTGHCCDWCEEVAGEYEYPDVPKDVYRRHRFCRCTVEYDPGNGRRQNVHSRKWRDIGKEDKFEKRKITNDSPDFYVAPNSTVFIKEHRKYIGKSNYDTLMEQYTNEESRKFIRTAYRKSASVGDGSTYAIRKMEIETGLNLGRDGRNHAKKVEDLIRQINKSLSKDIPEKDKMFLEKELERLMTVR